jgi:excisionase family DNA binding protein
VSDTPYLTVHDAAEVLGISDDGVRKLIRRGKLRAIRRSERGILIPRPAFEAYRRKISGAVLEPPRLPDLAATGTLEARAAAFELETGRTPEQWVAGWKRSDDDSAGTMRTAVTAVGLLAEQRTQAAISAAASA